MYLVSIAPAVPALREIAGSLEFADDRSGSPLGDPDLLRHFREAHRWVVGENLEHVRVVRDESEKMIAVTGS